MKTNTRIYVVCKSRHYVNPAFTYVNHVTAFTYVNPVKVPKTAFYIYKSRQGPQNRIHIYSLFAFTINNILASLTYVELRLRSASFISGNI